jgi:hypothetical protein
VRRATIALTVALLTFCAAGCSGGGGGSTATTADAQPSSFYRGNEPVDLDLAQFTSTIDNPYWPMPPGSRWVYREVDVEGTRQRVEVTVTRQTRKIMGIDTRVVHDVVTEDGQLIEDTYDWYAQDAEGNVWYLGEDTKEYENGKVTTTGGSWEAGVDGAQPGILLPGRPSRGMAYRQEYYKGEAEDAGEVLSLDEMATVPTGFYQHVLMTKDTTPLEPKLLEYKFYAQGVGPVLAVAVSGGSDRMELLRFQPAP